jgi:hypothetical protein
LTIEILGAIVGHQIKEDDMACNTMEAKKDGRSYGWAGISFNDELGWYVSMGPYMISHGHADDTAAWRACAEFCNNPYSPAERGQKTAHQEWLERQAS